MEHSYFIRITPYKTLSYEDIEKVLETLDISRWFVCHEEASRPHYHLCIWSLRSVENLRYRLKQEIEGQIYISGKQIEDKIKAIAYCMKDGNYRHKNINILDIMSAKAISKKKPHSTLTSKTLILLVLLDKYYHRLSTYTLNTIEKYIDSTLELFLI